MHAEIGFSDDSKGSLSLQLVYEGDKKHYAEIPDSFKGKKLESFFLSEKRIIVVSLGAKETAQLDYFRRAASKATKIASAYKFDSIHFSVTGLGVDQAVALFEGAALANYAF